jgi:hypothetical protein
MPFTWILFLGGERIVASERRRRFTRLDYAGVAMVGSGAKVIEMSPVFA